MDKKWNWANLPLSVKLSLAVVIAIGVTLIVALVMIDPFWAFMVFGGAVTFTAGLRIAIYADDGR